MSKEPYSSLTLLLVNDDEAFLMTLGRALEAEGFMVIQANGGLEAIEAANPFIGFIDVLVTDLIMPSIGGVDLVDRLRALQVNIPVVFLSGWPLHKVLGGRTLNYPHD